MNAAAGVLRDPRALTPERLAEAGRRVSRFVGWLTFDPLPSEVAVRRDQNHVRGRKGG